MKIKFNSLDVLEIQECLWSYQLLLNSLSTESQEELDMKNNRVESVNYLINKCEKILTYNNEVL